MEHYWLLGGIATAGALLGFGGWVGYRLGHALGSAPVALLEHRIADLAAQVAELLEQGEAGVAAAQLVVDGERRRAAARAGGDPRERVRLLLDAGSAPGGDQAGASPGAPAEPAPGPAGAV